MRPLSFDFIYSEPQLSFERSESASRLPTNGKGPAESPPLGERNAKSTLGLWKTAKTYIYMYIDKIFPKKTVETGVYSMLNG